jgi:hypothetical protein
MDHSIVRPSSAKPVSRRHGISKATNLRFRLRAAKFLERVLRHRRVAEHHTDLTGLLVDARHCLRGNIVVVGQDGRDDVEARRRAYLPLEAFLSPAARRAASAPERIAPLKPCSPPKADAR